MPAQQNYLAQEEQLDQDDCISEACYHWSNTMVGGEPHEPKKYGFTIAFATVWLFVLLVSWMAYRVIH